MCQTFQRCPIFHFGYSKIFFPFISSGSNLHQCLTAYSLSSKWIRLFTPNFTLTFYFNFPLSDETETIFFHQSNCQNDQFWPIRERQKIFYIFYTFALLYTILGDFWSILRHKSNPLSFQCSQPLYISLHFRFSSFQRRFIKRAGQKRWI